MNKKQSEDECIFPEIFSGSSEPVNTKQQAVWDKRATLALLALYEANIENIDHPKKKTKIWSKISMGLLEHGIEVMDDFLGKKGNVTAAGYCRILYHQKWV
ncbi:uncharacterized protein LOC143893733 isoform X2 [Temnothorax americanus]|uniref:uncharacterized protein LOC143893733 isoform X2 n=1 Tax=Temnothorax americanus TaxID=1964332 RepID=UPI0040697A9D